MRHIAALVAIAGILSAAAPGWAEDAHASTPPAPEPPAHIKLAAASPSVDALIDRLLDALANKDASALNRLRVTEDEYRTILLPGSGELGQPARVYDDASSSFAWQMLNTNSTYAAAGLMRDYGGRTYKLKEITYLKGHKQYAWYTAHKTVALKLEDETGNVGELVLGSIAEIDGQFKFVSLLGDR